MTAQLSRQDYKKAIGHYENAKYELWERHGIATFAGNIHISEQTNKLLTYMLIEMQSTHQTMKNIESMLADKANP